MKRSLDPEILEEVPAEGDVPAYRYERFHKDRAGDGLGRSGEPSIGSQLVYSITIFGPSLVEALSSCAMQRLLAMAFVMRGMLAVWVAGHNRRAGIRCCADGHFQRNFA